jgi:hypothetical protein
MGSSGSYFLAKWLEEVSRVNRFEFMYDYVHDGKTDYPYKHQPHPPSELILENAIVIYTYCTPFNHALGMFGKRKKRRHIKHCRNMGGDAQKLKAVSPMCHNKVWVQQYGNFIKNGVDYFGYFNHLNNWLSAKTPYRRVLLKYETLEHELENLMNLLELTMPTPPEFRKRRSDYRTLPTTIKSGLMEMFAEEYKLYESLDSITIV